MGKDGGANHIVMAMHGICAPDHWHAHAAIAGVGAGLVQAVGQAYPVGQAGVFAIGPGAAAIEH